MNNLKAQIQSALNQFANGSLLGNAKALLNTLGYKSERAFQLTPNNYEGFAEQFAVSQSNFNPDNAKTKDWQSIDIIFQITQDDIRKTQSLFQAKQVDNKIIESYLFFTLSLKGDAYSRSDLVRITREINNLTPMPAMILFRYNNYLTISVIDRRQHKREASKDVLEKVTLIKDINIQKPHRAHIEILYDLSLQNLIDKYSISNFIELHNAWQKTLDTSELNKKFYRELANWYFWAVDNVEFPDDEVKDKGIRNATNLIRLITRIIFIWFIKEKALVPENLFKKNYLNSILNDFNKNNKSHSYYQAILQNLFFGTLNQKMGERGFVKEGSFHENKNEYGVKNLFRYADRFKIKEKEVIELFKDIPFLNGGLFDCLDKPNDEGKIIYADGFTRNTKKQAVVPDILFFGDEQDIDLNKIFGTNNKKYKVQGLINLLESYKFTVAENTPIEEEIALDPELLGKVFENLLASYNPETQTTARKQTGSFYTPREIVNYMVDESLIAYLQNKLPSPLAGEGKGEEDTNESRLRRLLSYSDEFHQFTHIEVDALINAIDNAKILDPACGSGAFPMGILHKLVHILHKLDPKNEQWKKRQIEKAKLIDDPNIRQNAINDIETAFESNELDYGRKLYLIENSIYGVDIQSIAVQIAKLRFFISLIIDEKKQAGKENLGIRSLPNLETKFVAANTLIGLDKPQGQQSFRNPEIERLEKELKQLRHEYFNAKTRKEKLQCQKQDKKLRQDSAGLLIKDGWNDAAAQQIVKFDPYDQNASAEFFDPEWMFGIKNPSTSAEAPSHNIPSPARGEGSGEGGFDIVIGNPPYVRVDDIEPKQKEFYKRTYHTCIGKYDIYYLFFEKGVSLISNNGVLIFISPNKFCAATSAVALRKLLFTLASVEIVSTSKLDVFDDASNYPIITKLTRNNMKTLDVREAASILFLRESTSNFYRLSSSDSTKLPDSIIPINISQLKIDFTTKLLHRNDSLYSYLSISEGLRIPVKFEKEIPNDYMIVKQYQFDKWSVVRNGAYISKTNLLKAVSLKSDRYLKINQHKILIAEDALSITATIDRNNCVPQGGVYFGISTKKNNLDLRILLGILNSKLLSMIYEILFGGMHMRGGYLRYRTNFLESLPIPKDISEKRFQKVTIGLVDQILAAKKKDPNADTSALEREIDKMVYALYGLTPEEIEIIENHTKE